MTSQSDLSIATKIHGVSANKVFAIPELLEAILILLTPKDILLSHRVAKHWKQTIDGSKRIRQALFLDPVPAQTAWIAWIPSEDIREHNATTFAVGKFAVTQVSGEEAADFSLINRTAEIVSTKVTLNTLLHMRGHWKHQTIDDRLERGEGLRLGRTKKNILGHGRQMFLTQPPCKEVLVWIDWGQPKRVYDEAGVRFRQVLEITDQATVTAYLPHMFMLAKGVIALTEAEEVMVREELDTKRKRDGPHSTLEV